MIRLFKKSEDTDVLRLKTGDKLRLPVKMDWASSCGEYGLYVFKSPEGCDDTEGVEVPYGNMVHFKCRSQGVFSVRIRDYSATGDRQFAIYLNGKKFYRGFRGKADSLNEYVEKAHRHFRKVNGWTVERLGNILRFTSSGVCDLCGASVSVGRGDYNLLNNNNPCVSAAFDGSEPVTGRKCYSLRISSIVEGNKVVVNGITYTAGKSDNAQTMRDRITGGKGYICIPNTEMLSVSTQNGTRVVSNTNNPQMPVSYSHSDAEKDYYLVSVFDVREGNIFNINGIQVISSGSDTAETIADFYNSDGGYFSTDIGSSLAVSVVPGVRFVDNINNPAVTIALIEDVPTANKDKYTITICDDVAAGNLYSIDGVIYTAKPGDTAIDVAYNMFGENTNIFTLYKNTGVPLETSVEKGFSIGDESVADVVAISETVECCQKNSMIFEFDAKEPGCYAAVLVNDKGIPERYFSRIIVDNFAQGELVEFNNSGNAYGIDFDKEEWFSMRLPLFLRDITPNTYEEVYENIQGQQVRGVTRITQKREFVTHSVDTGTHDTIMKVLKSQQVRINGDMYTFIGEYNLPPHRQGIKDARMATGVLTFNGVMSSLEGCG